MKFIDISVLIILYFICFYKKWLPKETYFAIQTRKQEITEQEYDSLSDDEKRFYQRKLTRQGNYTLQKVASSVGA